MSNWISVKDELPSEPKEYDQKWVDVWSEGQRIADANFFDGQFHSVVEDHQGDFDSHEKINNVTHWMVVEPPKDE